MQRRYTDLGLGLGRQKGDLCGLRARLNTQVRNPSKPGIEDRDKMLPGISFRNGLRT